MLAGVGSAWRVARAGAGGLPATYTVNSTGDAPDANIGDGTCQTAAGVCSLRAAIQEANATPNNTIAFSIGAGGVQTIAPQTSLPPLSSTNILIDGSTQPGAGAVPIVVDRRAPSARLRTRARPSRRSGATPGWRARCKYL